MQKKSITQLLAVLGCTPYGRVGVGGDAFIQASPQCWHLFPDGHQHVDKLSDRISLTPAYNYCANERRTKLA